MTTMVEQDETTPAERTHLSDLVRHRRAELRLSLRALEARTIAPEGGEPVVKFGWINRLEKHLPVNPPQLPELQALARALELPLGRLQDAAGAQFLGIDTVWSASGEARALVEQVEKFTPKQREQLAKLLAAFESSPRPE
ncbi:XRE family transcriptional regulator [Streptomyces sp. NPDC053048]|uniref:XRE family transcriptional regulator n=1 Tax=Streptomyces sp. NPDC053048 TaxID=3365694 RepID=UPI0037D95BCA